MYVCKLDAARSLPFTSFCRSADVIDAGSRVPSFFDVYLCEQDAQRALEDCLPDEPAWSGLLRVEEIELAGMLQSAN